MGFPEFQPPVKNLTLQKFLLTKSGRGATVCVMPSTSQGAETLGNLHSHDINGGVMLVKFFSRTPLSPTLFSNQNAFLKFLSIGTRGYLFQKPIFWTPGVHLDLKTRIFRAVVQIVVTNLLSTMCL